MKRILFVSSNKWHPWGGSEILWFETAKHFINNSFEVGICMKKWKTLPSQFMKVGEEKNVQFFFRERNEPIHLRLLNRVLPSKNKISWQDRFKLQILAWKPSLVVISQGDNKAGLELMEFCKLNHLKYVTISQAANEAEWPGDEICRRLSLVYNNAINNYFVSEANLHLTEMQIGSKMGNAKIIRNPFNVEYDNKIGYPSIEKGFKIACVGRYDFVAKGQDILLQVLSSDKWKGRNISVNFYGKGMNEVGLSNLVNFFELKNVSVKGFVATSAIWETNHALIMSSRYEGLPLSIVEAMLCARICIVTDVSGNKELLRDNVDGFIAKAANTECLDEALERAWQKRNDWEQMGIQAKKNVQSKVPENPSLEFYQELEKILQTQA